MNRMNYDGSRRSLALGCVRGGFGTGHADTFGNVKDPELFADTATMLFEVPDGSVRSAGRVPIGWQLGIINFHVVP